MKFLQWRSAQRINTSIFHIRLNDFVICEISYMFRILVQNFLFRIHVQNSEWKMRYFMLSLNNYTLSEIFAIDKCTKNQHLDISHWVWIIIYYVKFLKNKCTKNQHLDISHHVKWLYTLINLLWTSAQRINN